MSFGYSRALEYLEAHTKASYKRSPAVGNTAVGNTAVGNTAVGNTAVGNTAVANEVPTAGEVRGLSLESIKELMSVLGDPQLAYRTIHVTGTNGKGSTTRLISDFIAATGLSVGAFTSPHLERINERIVWDGNVIPDEDFARVVSLIASVEHLLTTKPGRFDILAAIAFVWFAELAVDVAVIEVGLLGRFDSTNVVQPDVAVITNIAKDHTDGAPGWQREIAREKAGIIKPASHVILGDSMGELREVFEAEESIEVWEYGTDFEVLENEIAFGGRVFDIRTPQGIHQEVFLPVHGHHQGQNLATAIVATEAFFDAPLDRSVVDAALDGFELPGRFEVIVRDPTVILDGAHNPAGARSAKSTLDAEFARLGSWILVIGMLKGRNPAEVLEEIGAADFDAVFVTQPSWPRAISAEDVAIAAEEMGLTVEVVSDPVEAFLRARAVAAEDDLILVAGSLYLVGEIRPVARSVLGQP